MRRLRWLSTLVLAVHAFFVWLLILRPPNVCPGIDLDASWKQVIGLDFHEARRAGVESVFTYGPLGYFVASYPTYLPELFWQRLVADMVLKAGVVLCVFAPAAAMRCTWQRFVYLALVAVTGPISDDAFFLLAITASTLALSVRRASLALVLPTVAFFAVLGMGKFVYCVLALPCVALLSLNTWRRGGLRAAFAVPGTYVLAFASVWVAIGQSLGDVPAFLRGSIETTNGYGEAMRWVPNDGQRDYGADMLLVLASLSLGVLATVRSVIRSPRDLGRWSGAVTVCLASFLAWKSGVVHQEIGHMTMCCCCAALVPLWAWSLDAAPRRALVRDALAVGAVVVAFVGVFRLGGDFRPDTVVALSRHLAWKHWNLITAPTAERERLEAATRRLASEHRLPAVQNAVGDAPIDLVPHDQNVLFLNGLTVRHRPILQSYGAYTPWLQRLNGDFYADPQRGPQFVLFRLEAIDAQFPTVTDSQVYRALLAHFRPRLMEREWLLFERAADVSASASTNRREVARGTAGLGEWVPLEAGQGLGELVIDLDLTWLGAVSTFAVRGPRLFLDVQLADGRQLVDYATVRAAMRLPFLVDPLLRETRDFVQLYRGLHELPRVVAFRLRAGDGKAASFEPRFGYAFWRVDPPTPLDEATERNLRSGHPVFDRAPLSAEPAQNFAVGREGDVPVQVAEAPSVMTFADLRGRFAVSGAFGLRRASHEENGDTDGVTFRIERLAGGASTTVFERRLDPKRNERDRGLQWFAADVRLGDGESLVFRTLPGADARWDWSYWAALRFDDLDARSPSRAFSADVVDIERALGGTQRFRIDAGRRFANRRYAIFGTDAGTAPGVLVDDVVLPLNPSPWFERTKHSPAAAEFEAFRGTLDAEGRASAALHVPRDTRSGEPDVLFHTFAVVRDDGGLVIVGNPVPLRVH